MASAAVLRAGLLAAPPRLSASSPPPFFATSSYARVPRLTAAARAARYRRRGRASRAAAAITASWLDLTEDNVRLALEEAKSELGQLFDTSVGITGQVDLAELDGPFVKLRLKGKFWHTRATVVARIGNYLKNRIPEILEVEIEDEKQLDDSPAAF
ncbi:uncharacterized protein LOC120682597 isoform X1 [Panicum virgatum]|uniref:Uncharacterized protein n=1 Tax=Panicum virgatum TaxID=38727 RepID=A0A8T0W4G4_PANVG|nr:uncharacterized protein LOC120682597 isoform X1 [Panicum virgatum]XP_039820507.1 uncharacterized protein LOC120682597 isoform X1 [Panicum virgatum]XP_039820514.1 uncharacterized protein LOC120682597 isoform X1 [Panicum virgatum]KAG2644161.1 hypothetical protein PVAP13_2KG410200 [Panicum virgatum]